MKRDSKKGTEQEVLVMFAKVGFVIVVCYALLLIGGFVYMPAQVIISTIMVAAFCGIMAGYVNSVESAVKLYSEAVLIILIIGLPFAHAVYAGIKTRGTVFKHFVGGLGSLCVGITVVVAFMALTHYVVKRAVRQFGSTSEVIE